MTLEAIPKTQRPVFQRVVESIQASGAEPTTEDLSLYAYLRYYAQNCNKQVCVSDGTR